MIIAKTFVLSALVAGLLFGAQTARAQSDAVGPIPKSMTAEHEELHSELARLTQAGGLTGDAAKSVTELLDHHFAKENEYALPPLGLLGPLSQGKFECSMTPVLKMTDKLEAEMPTMLAEHKDMTLSDLIEGIVLHAFDGVEPFSAETRDVIGRLKVIYGLDLTAEHSHQLRDRRERTVG